MTDAPLIILKLREVEKPTPEKRRGFSPRQVAAVFIKYEGRCATCSEKVALDGYQIDHIQPLSALGKHELENWQLLCVGCHKPKTRKNNAEAKKGARIRGEKGQRARRERRGESSIKSRSTFSDLPKPQGIAGGGFRKPKNYVSPLSKAYRDKVKAMKEGVGK